MSRGQVNLPALAVALLALTSVVVASLAVADGAFAGATRSPAERRAAVALSERLVSADGPLADRSNVLNRSRLAELDATRLRSLFPVTAGHDVRIRLDDRLLVSTGDPGGGTTIRRIVLVAERQPRELRPAFAGPNDSVTLPRRSPGVTLDLAPPSNVTTVRVDGRPVLHDPGGLSGTFRVDLSRFETVTLSVNATGTLPRGSVVVGYAPRRTVKAELVVTVDA